MNPNLFFIYGEDTPSVRDELDRWKKGFVAKHGDSELEELEGESVSASQIDQSLRSGSFFGEKKLVILKNFLSSRKAEDVNVLVPLLAQIPESTVLLIAETSAPDKRSSAFKAVNTQAKVTVFEKPDARNFSAWIQKRALRHRCAMAPGSADHLLRWVGDDPTRLDNELQKLALYAEAKASQSTAVANPAQRTDASPTQSSKTALITPQLIDEIVPSSAEKSIFAWTDAFSQKNTSAFLKLFKELEAQGEDPFYLFAMLARQIRLLLQIKSLSDQGLSSAEIAKTLPAHPFVVQNTLKFTRHFSTQELTQKLRALHALDRRFKTGQIPLQPHKNDAYLLQMEKLAVE